MIRWRRWALPVALLPLLGLVGCSTSDDSLRGRIFLTLTVNNNEKISGDLIRSRVAQAQQVISRYRQLHPGVSVEMQVLHEEQLPRRLTQRNYSGLAPDLLLLNAAGAKALAQRGLLRPVTLTKAERDNLNPSSIKRVQLSNGTLAGLPFLQEPQVACFNKGRLATSPTTLQGLLQSSETGTEVGLSLDPRGIYWTAGGLGANEALTDAIQGKPLSGAELKQIQFWMQWLQAANMLQRVNYYSDQEALLAEFKEGHLDWIPCYSTSLQRLKAQLGSKLGVAPLPGDFGGPASPITIERVWAFGRNSSPQQRRLAESFAAFSINPLVQRNLTLNTQELLPVNSKVPPPVSSSQVLQVLVTAEQQGRASGLVASSIPQNINRDSKIDRMLARLVFGDLEPTQAATQLLGLLKARYGR